ncbi:unnamed protein product [Rotaria sordida]|uniref:Uncharacterized protein n=1 Tax=Rotaria sordida TaxID=392033 RepID=A0A818Z8F8_9BILA|nr:unnamed protein product [Rotaria sordida]CAF3766675.1 unnamed protein product [Rotaria sordida]
MVRTVRQGRNFYGSSTCSVTNTNDTNNITIVSNSSSLTSISASSQSNIGSVDVTKSIDHHRKQIILTINEWVHKNKENLSNEDFSLVQGIDYDVNVTVNPDTAIVRCACGVKSTLKLVHTTYQAKKCTMMKNKCSTINEEGNIEPVEKMEKNMPFDSSQDSYSTIINNNEASALPKKRHGSFASSIDQSTKRKRII